jgi:hypothetical protein
LSDETPEPIEDAPRPKWSPEGDPDGYTWDDIQAKDYLLESLLDFFVGFDDEGSGAIGITVQSNGATVSGIAISRRAWIDAMKVTMDASMTGGYNEALGTVFDKTAEHITGIYKRRDEADLPTRKRGFIHMRNVRILGGAESVELPLWRGTLEDVTGWSMGSWNPPGSAEPSE